MYPVPHLYRRLARLLVHNPSAIIRDLNHAIEYLDTAHRAMREWYNDEPRPATLTLLLAKLGAHWDGVKLLRQSSKLEGADQQSIKEVMRIHVQDMKETLESAEEECRELYGAGRLRRQSGYMCDAVFKWGERLERFAEVFERMTV